MKKIVMNKWSGGTMLAGLSLMSLPALAQDVESLDNGVATPAPQEQPAEGSTRLPITFTGGMSHQFSTDIDNNNGVEGKFSLTRTKFSLGMPVRLNDNFTLGTTVRYELSRFNFNDMVASPAFWRDINTLSASSILSWKADDKWTYYGGAMLKFAAESGTDWGQGTTGGGLAGVNYKVDDNLSIGGGLAVMSQIEENARVLPLITAKWKFADNWRLDVGLTDVSTFGYGASVKWLFSKEWEFAFGAQAHKSRFRIENLNGGVGQESATTVYADAIWHACSNIDLDAFFGVAAGGKLRVDDANGDKQFDTRYKAAPIFGGKVTFRF